MHLAMHAEAGEELAPARMIRAERDPLTATLPVELTDQLALHLINRLELLIDATRQTGLDASTRVRREVVHLRREVVVHGRLACAVVAVRRAGRVEEHALRPEQLDGRLELRHVMRHL